MAVSAHFIDHYFQLNSLLLECSQFVGNHTSINLSEALKRVAEEWNIKEKIVICISDNAANIKNAINLTGWKHFGCYAHSLNLIVEVALKPVYEI